MSQKSLSRLHAGDPLIVVALTPHHACGHFLSVPLTRTFPFVWCVPRTCPLCPWRHVTSALLYVVAIGVSFGGIWYEKNGRQMMATRQVGIRKRETRQVLNRLIYRCLRCSLVVARLLLSVWYTQECRGRVVALRAHSKRLGVRLGLSSHRHGNQPVRFLMKRSCGLPSVRYIVLISSRSAVIAPHLPSCLTFTQEEVVHGDESAGLLGREDSGYGSLSYLSQMPLMPQGYSRSDNYVEGQG